MIQMKKFKIIINQRLAIKINLKFPSPQLKLSALTTTFNPFLNRLNYPIKNAIKRFLNGLFKSSLLFYRINCRFILNLSILAKKIDLGYTIILNFLK
jgi:hypothetical protein